MHISMGAFITLLVILAIATAAAPFVDLHWRGWIRTAHRVLYVALTIFIIAACFW